MCQAASETLHFQAGKTCTGHLGSDRGSTVREGALAERLSEACPVSHGRLVGTCPAAGVTVASRAGTWM